MTQQQLSTVESTALSQDIIALVHSAKQRAAVSVNAELTLLYWTVGQRIQQEILKGERAEYGLQVIANLAKTLTQQLGKGWSKRNLAQMIKFAQIFPDLKIVQAVTAQLSWAVLPPKEILEQRLHLAMEHAKQRLLVQRESE